MSIKTSFSIKDLENLCGVKAHTIRIWEQRYGLLEPERSDTNIRSYDLHSLQKILNVVLLNQFGYKISRIARMDQNEIRMRVNELSINNDNSSHAVNSFKLAMLNFDSQLFEKTYNQLLTQNSFREVFLGTFLVLLEDIGTLWSTNTITPAHEHFISILIKQKLLVNIERIQYSGGKNDKTFVLFLPLNEIHELGLLYIHFELLIKGYHSIFIGPSVPMDSLTDLQKTFHQINFISYFTVEPARDQVESYLSVFSGTILQKNNEELHIIGRNTRHLDRQKLPVGVHCHSDIISLVNSL